MNYQINLGFILACLLFLFACQKEEILEQQDLSYSTNLSTLNTSSDENCIDDIEQEYINNGIRSSLSEVITSELSSQDIAQYGTPQLSATITDDIDETSSISLVPLFNTDIKETSAIIFFRTTSTGGTYKIISKSDVENNPSFLIELNPDDPSATINKDEFITLFYKFDCFLTCEHKEIRTRDPGKGCNFNGTSWWKKFKKWFGGLFSGGSGSDTYNGPLINPWGDFEGGDFTIPPIVGGGGSSGGSSGGNITNNPNDGTGPGENPGIDPSTWGDETGGNLPNNSLAEIACIYHASSSFFQTYEIQPTTEIRDLLNNSITGCQGISQGEFNAEAAVILAEWKHEELSEKYPDYVAAVINIETFLEEHGTDKYLATVAIYETYMEEVGDQPTDSYQWQLAMEVFYEELLPILLEFTPGVGDLIGSYNDFHEGNYFWGAFGIVSAFVPGDEIIKVIRKADNIRDAWKNVKKIFVLWNKLFSTVGGQRILNKLPQSWKDLPGSKLANGEGLFWRKDNFNNLRIMDANPNSSWPTQQVKYVRLTKNGQRLDKFGNPVPSTLPGGVQNPNFERDSHIPLSDVTDELLEIFFP